MDIREYDIKALAYIGDAVYEVYVRRHVMEGSREQVNKLHKKTVKYVSARAQAHVIECIENKFTDAERAIFKRGRNAVSNTVPKNTDVITYKIATGFEAVIGYVYLMGENERLEWLLAESIRIIEDKKEENAC